MPVPIDGVRMGPAAYLHELVLVPLQPNPFGIERREHGPDGRESRNSSDETSSGLL